MPISSTGLPPNDKGTTGGHALHPRDSYCLPTHLQPHTAACSPSLMASISMRTLRAFPGPHAK